jgi:hypothetical protein
MLHRLMNHGATDGDDWRLPAIAMPTVGPVGTTAFLSRPGELRVGPTRGRQPPRETSATTFRLTRPTRA